MILKIENFCQWYSDNFEFLERDEGVFNPKVKKESKNTLIQTTTSRGKNAKFFDAFSRRAEWQCRTRPNRGVSCKALNSRKVEGLRVTPPNLSRIGVDLGVECGTMFWVVFLSSSLIYEGSIGESVKAAKAAAWRPKIAHAKIEFFGRMRVSGAYIRTEQLESWTYAKSQRQSFRYSGERVPTSLPSFLIWKYS